MGQLYLGALPLAALTTATLLRGSLWTREIRFFTVAAALVLLYALGRYTPFFRAAFEILPGVSLFRRPADAALRARLPRGYPVRLHRPSLVSRGGPGGRSDAPHRRGAPCRRAARPVLRRRGAEGDLQPRGVADQHRRPVPCPGARRHRLPAAFGRPLVAARGSGRHRRHERSISRSTTGRANPPPCRRQPTTCCGPRAATRSSRPCGRGSARRRRRSGSTASSWPGSASTGPMPASCTASIIRSATIRSVSGSTARRPGPATMSPCRTSAAFAPLFPSYRSTLADLLGLRFIATGVPVERIDPNLRSGDLKLLAETSRGYVYENPRAGPRVSFAAEARPADFAALVRDGDWPDVDFATHRPRPSGRAPSPGSARSSDGAGGRPDRLVPNSEVVIEVDAAAPGYVVLYDPWHPWWFATVDGSDAPLIRRQCAVPHRPRCRRPAYRPLPVPAAGRSMAADRRKVALAASQCFAVELTRPARTRSIC